MCSFQALCVCTAQDLCVSSLMVTGTVNPMDCVEGKKSDDYMTSWVRNDILAFLYVYFSVLDDLDIIYALSCAN